MTRSISAQIIESDAMMSLPVTAQHLYILFCMEADDEGFVGRSRMIAAASGFGEPNDIEDLIDAGFLIRFPSGTVVITHWFVHYTSRKDRCKPTIYKEEKSHLRMDESGMYVLICEDCTNENSGRKADKNTEKNRKKGDVHIEEAQTLEMANDLTKFAFEDLGVDHEVAEKARDWLSYKEGRKEHVTEGQIKSFTSTLRKYQGEYGAKKVVELIDENMASGYSGVIWDKLKQPRAKPQLWKPAEKQNYDMESLEQQLLAN